MNRSIVKHLIAKDLYLYRWLIVGALVAGLVALPISGREGTAGNIGLILMMTAIIALGIFLAMYGVMAERQSKSLLFVLSLPISPMQYAIAKVAASLIAFSIPWSVVLATIVGIAVAFDPPPEGHIPFVVALMVFMFANFAFLLMLLLITRSEYWAVAGILGTNLGVAAYMNIIPRLPGIAGNSGLPDPVWSPQILATIGIEAAVVVLCLVVALYVQARRKDHV
jgi:ABC-type transport system involved in multi-copper enzyme maturation permease subunit